VSAVCRSSCHVLNGLATPAATVEEQREATIRAALEERDSLERWVLRGRALGSKKTSVDPGARTGDEKAATALARLADVERQLEHLLAKRDAA
jgi:hypothetical protein